MLLFSVIFIKKSLAPPGESTGDASDESFTTNGFPDYSRIIMEIIETAIIMMAEFVAASRWTNPGILIAGWLFAILFILESLG